MEAVQVLCRCEQRLGHKIPEEDIETGNLRKWLSSEDYHFSIDKVRYLGNQGLNIVMLAYAERPLTYSTDWLGVRSAAAGTFNS